MPPKQKKSSSDKKVKKSSKWSFANPKSIPPNFELTRIYSKGSVGWTIYNVVINAWMPYLNIRQTSEDIVDQDAFKKKLTHYGREIIKGVRSTDVDGKIVDVIYNITILDSDINGKNAVAAKTRDFKLFIDNIYDKSQKFVIISPCYFSSGVETYMKTERYENVVVYHYDTMKLVNPLRLGVPRHTVLTASEEEEFLLKTHEVSKANKKKICLNDPAVIWANGDVLALGKIVKLESNSPVAGIDTTHRVVGKPRRHTNPKGRKK
jgi:DNA-directed RNA polymerase subunit H (RpoH/RPB5)